MRQHVVEDLSHLPTYGFGPRMTTWWGTLSFCILEGTGFALGVGAYLYLAFLNPQWPLSAEAPGLLWSGLFTLVLLLSIVPNHLIKAAAKREDLRAVRRLLVIHLHLELFGVGLGSRVELPLEHLRLQAADTRAGVEAGQFDRWQNCVGL